jgi:hypothetical protein
MLSDVESHLASFHYQFLDKIEKDTFRLERCRASGFGGLCVRLAQTSGGGTYGISPSGTVVHVQDADSGAALALELDFDASTGDLTLIESSSGEQLLANVSAVATSNGKNWDFKMGLLSKDSSDWRRANNQEGGLAPFRFELREESPCPWPKFGKSCENQVHCHEVGGVCDYWTCYGRTGSGQCSSCKNGWTGPSCSTCASGFFGERCESYLDPELPADDVAQMDKHEHRKMPVEAVLTVVGLFCFGIIALTLCIKFWVLGNMSQVGEARESSSSLSDPNNPFHSMENASSEKTSNQRVSPLQNDLTSESGAPQTAQSKWTAIQLT